MVMTASPFHLASEVESLSADEQVLAELGYRQEFRRKFTLWSNFCLSFSSLGLLPSVAATLGFTLG
jgi:hypothetical protein